MLLRFSHKLSHLRRPAQASNICQLGRAVPRARTSKGWLHCAAFSRSPNYLEL